MSDALHLPEEERAPGRFTLPSLAIARFAIGPPQFLIAILLIGIGLTFGQPVGVTDQTRTAASLVAAISAVLMGTWSVRFNHKSLLLLGLVFVSISALGCSLAFNFPMMLIAFALSGLGMVMVVPMTFSLVGLHFPIEHRPRAIGWVLTGMALAGLIGSPVIGIIAGVGDWRLAFLGFVLPVSLISLMLTAKIMPSSARSTHPKLSQGTYWDGFKEVFTNRSALACLINSALGMAVYQVLELYGPSFFRERFLVSIEFVSILIFSGGASCYLMGFQTDGRLVNRFGRKPVTIFTAIVTGSRKS